MPLTQVPSPMLAPGTAGNGPAFAAYVQSVTQTIANATVTKVPFGIKVFDTASCYDNTNYRFTPNVAGYYQVNVIVQIYPTITNTMWACIYKNGTPFLYGTATGSASAAGELGSSINALMYFNGSTDYIEIYAYQGAGATKNIDTGTWSHFSASLVRAA